jgi:hypothetical protein
LVCRGQPQCKAFKWIDDPVKKKESTQASTSKNTNGEGNMKVTIEEIGKKITIEGLVDDVIEVMNKKLSM